MHRHEDNLDEILSVIYQGAHNHTLRPDEELEFANAQSSSKKTQVVQKQERAEPDLMAAQRVLESHH